MNSKNLKDKNRPRVKDKRRKAERAQIARFLRDLRDESYSPAIQLEFSFRYDHAPRNDK